MEMKGALFEINKTLSVTTTTRTSNNDEKKATSFKESNWNMCDSIHSKQPHILFVVKRLKDNVDNTYFEEGS